MKKLLPLLGFLLLPLSARGSPDSSFVKNWGLHKSVVQECLKLGVDPRVVVAIRWIEAYKVNGTVYPYTVRVNSGLSKIENLSFKGVKRVSKHVFVCSSKQDCISFVKKLISLGIKNFDAWLYQINYLHNGKKFKNYPEDVFDRIEAGKFVCRYVAENLKKYGFHANAVAYYHSFQKARNEVYAEKFYRVYKRLRFSGVKK